MKLDYPSSLFFMPSFDQVVTSFPLLPGQLLVRLPVLAGRLRHDFIRHAHTFFALQSGARQPVAEALLCGRLVYCSTSIKQTAAYLVVALLTPTDLVLVRGPEAGAVGRENFVHEHDFILGTVYTEFELGVGDNDAALGCVVAGPYSSILVSNLCLQMGLLERTIS